MNNIGVYVRKEVLEHKKRDEKGSQGRYCYWEFSVMPKVEPGDLFWFASEGNGRAIS